MKAVTVLTLSLVVALLAVVTAQPSQRYDLLIKNGRVMDGTAIHGSPPTSWCRTAASLRSACSHLPITLSALALLLGGTVMIASRYFEV